MKNYVKEYKGYKVPEGATHFTPEGEDEYLCFYRLYGEEWEIYVMSDRIIANLTWCSASELPKTAIPLPEVNEKKMDYRNPLLKNKQEWNGEGLPPIGTTCLTMHNGDLVECLYIGKGLGAEYIYQVSSGGCRGEIDRLIGSPRFRPLKTQQEKDREAFILKAAEVYYAGVSSGDMAAALFDAGFTAPKDGDNDK